ncbi:MAG: DUF5615 family PIN-like protein [Pseudomonadota bacterium]
MNFLIDQNLPPAMTDWLNAKGHNATHVREIGLKESDDPEVIATAVIMDAVIVTKDSDYSTIDQAQVVWLRIGNATNPSLFDRLERVWRDVETSLLAGDQTVIVDG